MKNILPKLMSVFNLAKGKKPIVLILSVVAVFVMYYAAHKGWIASDIVSVEQIVDGVSSAFPNDTVQVVVDSVSATVDPVVTEVVVDTLAN